MNHTTVNISMPKTLGRWVKTRISSGGYGNASEYFRDLIRKDQKELSQGEIEAQLLSALGSGKETPLSPSDFEELRRELRQKIARKKKA